MPYKDHERRKAYYRANYAARRAEKLAKQRIYRANHTEIIRERDRLYRANHSEELHAHSRAYRATHKEKIFLQQRAYSVNHQEKVAAYHRAYRASHHEAIRANHARRRAKKRLSVATLTASQWKTIIAAYKSRCAYCGKKPKNLTIDHVVPLARNGTHTAENVVPSCSTCNFHKHTNAPPTIPAKRLLL